jgi:hypothetical protein
MKFNSYLIELNHKESSLSSSMVLNEETIQVNCKRVLKDIFVAHFKSQIQLTYLQSIELKSRNKSMVVLLPIFSKYNKRKLTKISKTMMEPENRAELDLIKHYLSIEKILRVNDLLSFISISRIEAIDFLLHQELNKKIKIIDFTYLSITQYDNYLDYYNKLNEIFLHCYTNGVKAIKLSEIESQLKLPGTSLFLRYLIKLLDANFSFNFFKDKIIFQKVGLSKEEKSSIMEVQNALKKKKSIIFTIDEIIKLSELSHKEVNDSIWYLVDDGQVVQLNDQNFIFKEEINKILNKLKKFKRNQGEDINIQDFREITLFNRKDIIILFEYFDSQNITERIENKRKILLVV